MPTVLACLRRSVERMWPPRVPTRFGPGTRLRRPKNQWNQGPLATPQAEMCPRTANSGLSDEQYALSRPGAPIWDGYPVREVAYCSGCLVNSETIAGAGLEPGETARS